jgi:MFS family permease
VQGGRLPHPDNLSAGGKNGSRFFYGYIIVICGFLVLFVALGLQYCFGIFFTPLIQEFGWSRAVTSTAFSIGQVAAGIMGIFTGRLSDSYGPKTIILCCGIFLGLACILMSTTNSIWQLILYIGVFLGIGVSCSFAPVLSSVSRWFWQKRGLMTGIVVSGIGFGIIVFPLMVNKLLSVYSWRVSFIILGVIALVVVVTLAFFMKRDPQTMGLLPYGEKHASRGNPAPKEEGLSLRGAMHTSRFWMICATYVIQGFAVMSILTHVAPHAITIGVDAASAASIISFVGIGSIIGRIVMSGISDRLSVKVSLAINFAVLFLSLLWLLIADQVWMLYLFGALFGFGYGGTVGLQAVLAAEMFGLAAMGSLIGMLTFSVSLGGTIGPAVTGYIYDVSGSYRTAFIIFSILMAVGLALSLTLRPATSKKMAG